MLGGIGHRGVEAQRLRDFAADFPDGAFVVDDQEVQEFAASIWTGMGALSAVWSYDHLFAFAFKFMEWSGWRAADARKPVFLFPGWLSAMMVRLPAGQPAGGGQPQTVAGPGLLVVKKGSKKRAPEFRHPCRPRCRHAEPQPRTQLTMAARARVLAVEVEIGGHSGGERNRPPSGMASRAFQYQIQQNWLDLRRVHLTAPRSAANEVVRTMFSPIRRVSRSSMPV